MHQGADCIRGLFRCVQRIGYKTVHPGMGKQLEIGDGVVHTERPEREALSFKTNRFHKNPFFRWFYARAVKNSRGNGNKMCPSGCKGKLSFNGL